MASVVALGSGLVGQFVIERLLEADHNVIVIDLQIPEALHQHPRVEARQGGGARARGVAAHETRAVSRRARGAERPLTLRSSRHRQDAPR